MDSKQRQQTDGKQREEFYFLFITKLLKFQLIQSFPFLRLRVAGGEGEERVIDGAHCSTGAITGEKKKEKLGPFDFAMPKPWIQTALAYNRLH